jgi:hypothetical protein
LIVSHADEKAGAQRERGHGAQAPASVLSADPGAVPEIPFRAGPEGQPL